MTKNEIINACIRVVERLRKPGYIPWDTGNMATHGLAYEITTETFRLYMDIAEAPYMPYTNEPWTAARFGNRKNPNEGWWNRFCDLFSKELALELRGNVK